METLINSFTPVLTAILTAVLAVVGLFLDREKPYFKALAGLFILFTLVLGYIQIRESTEANKEAGEAKDRQEKLIGLADNTATSVFRTSTYLTDILLSQPKILKDFGLTEIRAGKNLNDISTIELITGEILKANKALEKLVSQRLPSKRQGSKIWYYNKEMDNPYLKSALKEMGFDITDKVAAMNQVNDLTNAVWHGPDVNLVDYKIVLLSLIRAGVDIRRAGTSCKNLGTKVNTIEIGASDQAAGLINGIKSPTIPVDQIVKATTFGEIDNFNCN